MTDSLTRLLHERTADEPVGPPPLGDLHRTVGRRRRGRLAVVGAVAAVLAVAGGLAAIDDRPRPEQRPAPAADVHTDAPPAGHRWVGQGRAVIAVPVAWGTNAEMCGTPQADTVVVDLGATCLALVQRPKDVESVWVREPIDGIDETDTWTETTVDGVRVLRSPVTSGGRHHSASAYVPSEGTVFAAQSTSVDGAERVTALLDGVRVLHDHVTVPGLADLDWLNHPKRAARRYGDRVRASGLVPEWRARESGETGVLVTPSVGTAVEPGAVVVIER